MKTWDFIVLILLNRKRVKKLTGDINISDMFKNECEARGIPIYNAYNIQKRLIHEVEQEQLDGVDKVDDKINGIT